MAAIPIFDGTDYDCWAVKMQTLLLSKGLWDTVQKGYDETNEEEQQKDAKALCLLQQGVSERIFPRIKVAKKANQAWRNILVTTENLMTRTDLRQAGATQLIVATLVATVAFTAGFTMPGGYNGNDGPNHGMAILTRELAFKAFMVTDTIAMSLSTSAVLIHLNAAMTNNLDKLERKVYSAAYLISYAAVAMVLAFVTGTYAVLAHSSGLAISVCVIGCFPLPFFLITDIWDIIKGIFTTRQKDLVREGRAPKSVSVVMYRWYATSKDIAWEARGRQTILLLCSLWMYFM
ncbi:unnamed protein product [Camellia sinensis]